MNKKNDITMIDLFAGIGGFRLGLEKIGAKCIGFSEVNKDAIHYYLKNHNEKNETNFGDIKKIETLPYCDILTGGVPCQSWSTAGKKLGFEDDRGQLWNDTIFLLNKTKPKVFIFENVKGLVDPRNKDSFNYILERLKDAGYYCDYKLIKSSEYGVPQNRERVYIVGFRSKKYFEKFKWPETEKGKKLNTYLDNNEFIVEPKNDYKKEQDNKAYAISKNSGFNDYFSFNDLRSGETTIHSWDIIKTTKKEKEICNKILSNRRKKEYGPLDGNPLSFESLKKIIPTITEKEIKELINKKILVEVDYKFKKTGRHLNKINTSGEKTLIEITEETFITDEIKKNIKIRKESEKLNAIIERLKEKEIIICIEKKYAFKNSKISTGLFGINRIFLPNADIYPTLVASDTNDYIATKMVYGNSIAEYRNNFITEIYNKKNYRKISKKEACKIQGFSENYELPEKRNRWMKLIGNSVSVPVIEKIGLSILKTSVFED